MTGVISALSYSYSVQSRKSVKKVAQLHMPRVAEDQRLAEETRQKAEATKGKERQRKAKAKTPRDGGRDGPDVAPDFGMS